MTLTIKAYMKGIISIYKNCNEEIVREIVLNLKNKEKHFTIEYFNGHPIITMYS